MSQEGFVHIRIQQRNGRKTVTTVQGIGDEYDKKKIVKVCKKVSITQLLNFDTLQFKCRKQVDSSLSKNQALRSLTTVIINYHYNYIAINIQ